MEINNDVILAVHRLLLGAIGVDILYISLSQENTNLLLNVFHQAELTQDQIDELEASTTDIYTMMPDRWTDVFLRMYKVDETGLIPRLGVPVFMRLGIRYKTES